MQEKVECVYKEIGSEHLTLIELKEFAVLPVNWEVFDKAYIGKHKVIQPNDKNPEFSIDPDNDFKPHLLIECRLYNEYEEYFITAKSNKVMMRHITSKNQSTNSYEYIDKRIQLRNLNASDERNETLTVRHYIDAENGGYSFLRYMGVEPKKI